MKTLRPTLSISEKLAIKDSEAKHFHSSDISTRYAPQKVYDGDLDTSYNPNEFDTLQDNFLKLYLAEEFPIGLIKITNRRPCCGGRIVGTVVSVYSTKSGGETKVADCGDKIPGFVSQLTTW